MIVIIVICIALAMVVMWFIHNRREPFKVNTHRLVEFHYVDWCPYCKMTLQVWNKTKHSIVEPSIRFAEINEGKRLEIPSSNKSCGYDVWRDSHPTITMVTEYGKRYEYAGIIDEDKLRAWILSHNLLY